METIIAVVLTWPPGLVMDLVLTMVLPPSGLVAVVTVLRRVVPSEAVRLMVALVEPPDPVLGVPVPLKVSPFRVIAIEVEPSE